MAKNIKLKKGPWTDQEIAFVLANYGRMTTRQISDKMHRAYGGVAYQIQNLRKRGLIGYEVEPSSRSRPASIIETTTAVPVIATKKPWWKFW